MTDPACPPLVAVPDVEHADFDEALRSVIAEMRLSGAAEVGFGNPVFDAVVPPFGSIEWIELAPRAAALAALFGAGIVIEVLLATDLALPVEFKIESLAVLPSAPPRIRLLKPGRSEFEARIRSPWHSDMPQLDRVVGWVGAVPETTDGPMPDTYLIKLCYETVGEYHWADDPEDFAMTARLYELHDTDPFEGGKTYWPERERRRADRQADHAGEAEQPEGSSR